MPPAARAAESERLTVLSRPLQLYNKWVFGPKYFGFPFPMFSQSPRTHTFVPVELELTVSLACASLSVTFCQM